MPAHWVRNRRHWHIGVVIIILALLAGCALTAWHARTGPSYTPVSRAGQHPDGAPLRQFTSVDGRPIDVLVFGRGPRTVMVMAGVHGDEPESIQLARKFIHYLQTQPESALQQRVVVMPVVNPDGLVAHTRSNAHRIDVNRNFPTKDFGTGAHTGRYGSGDVAASEPETQAVMQVIEHYQPALIISIHAPLGVINYNGPAKEIARHMAQSSHFPVVSQLSRPTPGSLGTFYGKERGLPVITLEVIPGEQQWERHGNAILDTIGMTSHGK